MPVESREAAVITSGLRGREMPSVGLTEIILVFLTMAVYVAIPVLVIVAALRLLGFGRNNRDTR